MLKYALIGYGGIAKAIVDILSKDGTSRCDCVAVLVRQESRFDEELPFVTTLDELLDRRPNIVVECAGHEALAKWGDKILNEGYDLSPASVGALADNDLYASLIQAAEKGGAQLILPAGAIGGIDALAAAKASGLKEVLYRGRKPASSWVGTPAEKALDLASLTEPEVHFSGSARDAARLYPKNANVAATVALAGLGFDETRVELIADPTTNENTHEVDVKSAAGSFSIRLQGHPSPSNPKTSMLTAYSLARTLQNLDRSVVV